MAAPGWRILLTDTLVVLPRPFRWNSVIDRENDELGHEENASIINETIRGVEYSNKLFERFVANPIFRVPSTELPELRALHRAVSGDVTPFWFYPNSSDTAIKFYVKKEPDFKPTPVFPGVHLSAMRQWWDYELHLRTIVEAAQILA